MDKDTMREALEDHYSNLLFDMSDEELEYEYNEVIGKE